MQGKRSIKSEDAQSIPTNQKSKCIEVFGLWYSDRCVIKLWIPQKWTRKLIGSYRVLNQTRKLNSVLNNWGSPIPEKQSWSKNKVQVRCTILDAWGWCTGMTQREGMAREEGGGFRMGNTCIPVADSFWYLAKLIQLCKV